MPNASRAHKLRHGLAVIAFAFSLPALADAGKAAAFYEDGLARFEKGDTAGAVIQLKNALQQNNKLLSAHVLLGRALLKQTELPAAEAAFNEALKLGVSPSEIAVPRGELLLALGRTKELLRDVQPDGLRRDALVEVLSMRGTALADEGDIDAARRSFKAATDADPRSVRPYLSLVPFLLQLQEFSGAQEGVERAIILAPKDARVWNLRASLQHVRGNLEAALSDYEQALEVDANYVDARVARAALLVDLKRDAEAKKDLDYLAEHVEAEPRSAYLRAVVAGRRGDAEGVHKALTEVTRLVDTLPTEYVNAREQLLMLGALAHHGLGVPEKAKSYLDSLLNRYPRNLGARKLLASIYMAENDSARTLSTIEPVLKLRPDDPQALLLAGRASLADKRYRRATQYLERAAEMLKGDAQIQAALGYSLIGGGQAEEGAASLERAFVADPRNGAVGMVLTSIYMRQGMTDKAIQVAEALVKNGRDNLSALNLLGAIRAASGDVVGARKAYEEVVARDPEFVPALLNLARVEAQEGKLDAAKQRLTALLKQRKDDARVMYELGMLAQRGGQMKEAIEWLRTATAKNPDDPRAGLALVEALSATRQPSSALAAAKEVGLRHPQDLSVQAVLGQTYLAAGDANAARLTFRDMTRLAEFEPEAQVRIGRLQLEAGFPDEAGYNVQKALTAVKDYRPALTLAVEVALVQKNLVEARKLLDDLRKADPEAADVASLEAAAALASGDTKQAIPAYQRAYRKAPSASSALNLARAFFSAGQADTARKVLQDEVGRLPSADVRRALIELQMQAGLWADARQNLDAMLASDAASVDLLNNLAIVQLALKDRAALATAEKARALAPQDPLVIDTVGWIKLNTGDIDGALGLLREARLRAPQNREVRYHLAQALHQSGRTAEARKELLDALADGGRFPGVEDARALQKKIGK
ncbi:XrtA/PEP-CTERM system TPR-repeat protein PrsT [Denitromonas halophila]|nr:XrtA/PEP-CTERM system TPR-repeat protein PrsT [Denitromonas halophila]